MESQKLPTGAAESEVPEGIRRARAAFLRDYTKLIADRRFLGKYICYHKEEMVGVNKDYLALIREVNAKSIPEDASLIFKVIPGEDREQQLIADEAEIDPDYQ